MEDYEVFRFDRKREKKQIDRESCLISVISVIGAIPFGVVSGGVMAMLVSMITDLGSTGEVIFSAFAVLSMFAWPFVVAFAVSSVAKLNCYRKGLKSREELMVDIAESAKAWLFLLVAFLVVFPFALTIGMVIVAAPVAFILGFLFVRALSK